VLKVKLDVATVTGIAVSKQEWTGWPEAAQSDELSLAQIGIPREHSLTVNDKSGARNVSADCSFQMTRLGSTAGTALACGASIRVRIRAGACCLETRMT
jgi:hypothetical protein